MWRWWGRVLALVLALVLLSACAARRPPIIIDRTLSGPATHTVVAGDTLYSIALRYDKDYHDIARINGLGADFLIRPGQRLRLDGEPVPTLQNTQNKSAVTKSVSTEKTPTAPAKGADSLSSTQKPVPKPAQKAVTVTSTKTTPVISAQSESKAAAVPSVTPSVSSKPESKPDIKTDVKADVKVPAEQKVAVVEPTATATPRTSTTSSASGNLSWLWPAKGSLSGKFGGEGLSGKGINILGKRGDPVLAAASGTVVYAGSGLVGYGKLLIVRHDDTYISAYAYNEKFLVTEGDAVKAGQPIAEMGASGTDRDKLHFEIRERGKPVDPLRFLPNR